jgi:hypothetical protein
MSRLSRLNDLIQQIEIMKLKQMYEENKELFETISDFIIHKNLMLYGGLTINLLLPKKHRFYKDYTLNDFDCFSKNAYKHSLELGTLIKKKGYKYVKIRRAIHKDTYRVYVHGIQVIDITQLDSELYNKLQILSTKERSQLKYYKDKYNIIPIIMIKRNLYYELSRPIQSGFRWEKIFKRLNLFMKFYKHKRTNKEYPCIPYKDDYKPIVKELLIHIKKKAYPIIDSYALKLYLKKNDSCCCRVNKNSKFLVIIADNYEHTKNEIINLVNIQLDNNKYQLIINEKNLFSTFINPRTGIDILDKTTNEIFRLITIIQSNNECFAVQKINGYTVGSIDTILYFLYSYYLINFMTLNDNSTEQEIFYLIGLYEKYIDKNLKNNIDKRLKINCYGKINTDEFVKVNWKKRATIKYL